jgi:hypothetical protein
MKLAKPLVWKSGLVALGVLSVVSLHSVGAQTTTTTPSAGNAVTTPANAANGNGVDNGNDTDAGGDNGYGHGQAGGNWSGGPGGMMGGPGGMFGGRHGGMRGERGGRFGANATIGGVSAQAIADYLGLTTEQLKADLDAGESLAQIAVAQGKTRDDLRTFMIQQSTTAIDAALDQTTTSKANGSTTGGNGTAANSTPSAAATPAV